MSARSIRLLQISVAAAMAAFALAAPSHALTLKECGAKYKAAKAGGTLNGQSWNDFRKSSCGASAPGTQDKPVAKADAKPVIKPAATAATGPAVFPKAVDAKYAKETAAKARMHTCLDQYRVNKAANGNGGMKWIEKGGGYFSKCNAALKS